MAQGGDTEPDDKEVDAVSVDGDEVEALKDRGGDAVAEDKGGDPVSQNGEETWCQRKRSGRGV